MEKNLDVSGNKFIGLEVVRFLCALSVLVWHFQHFFELPGASAFAVGEQPLNSVFHYFYTSGHQAVRYFWALSGFVFFWKYSEDIGARRVGAWRFFVLRFSRLYPLHFATLLLVLLLQAFYFHYNSGYFVYQNNDLKHFLLQLFMASNWAFNPGLSFNGSIWSVSVEVFVYFVFYFVSLFVGRSFRVVFALILLSVVARALGVINPVVECFSFFYVGGLAVLFLSGDQWRWLKGLPNTVHVLLALASVAYVANQRDVGSGYYGVMVSCFFVLVSFSEGWWIHRGVHKVFEFLGNLTYSSYLIHFPFQLLIVIVCDYFFCGVWKVWSGLVFFVYIFGVFCLSVPVYYLFEKPVQGFLRSHLMEREG
ncbi:acyltransferase family protein [Uliginosibacterium aquaticum]|uniref:Acyltransferase n=1 Tax=Uliginosibacterium aquaticum TaxID=2731212 RepID=A0ABX2IC19_9RHOO|nr:acyltransferase [Uliginosibacterium aquaticum]NSL54035.1 acyltransferase [Uliginosibacterium aquaticum]